MQYLTSFLLSATLVAAAPMTPRSPFTLTTSDRMTTADVNSIYKTCWSGQLQWPLPNTPLPCKDVPAQQLSLFSKPSAKSGVLTVHNYCDYDIHFLHLGNGLSNSGTLAKKSVIEQPLTGTVFKASKSANMAQDVLIEYNNAADGKLWYDLSLITCLGSSNGLPNSDTSACAGHEGGLQLGNQGAMSFQCAPGAWCDDQAYLYQENLCKKQNPVSQCSGNLGLTMEFCTSKK